MNLQPLHSAAINGDQIWYGSGDASVSLALVGAAQIATKGAGDAALAVASTGDGVFAVKGSGAGTIKVEPTNQPLVIETWDDILLENGTDRCVMEFGSSIETFATQSHAGAKIVIDALGATQVGIAKQGSATIRLIGKYDIPDRLPVPSTYRPSPTSRLVQVMADVRDLHVSQERRRA